MSKTPDIFRQTGADALAPLSEAQIGAWSVRSQVDAIIGAGGSLPDPEIFSLAELEITPTQIANILEAVAIPEVES